MLVKAASEVLYSFQDNGGLGPDSGGVLYAPVNVALSATL